MSNTEHIPTSEDHYSGLQDALKKTQKTYYIESESSIVGEKKEVKIIDAIEHLKTTGEIHSVQYSRLMRIYRQRYVPEDQKLIDVSLLVLETHEHIKKTLENNDKMAFPVRTDGGEFIKDAEPIHIIYHNLCKGKLSNEEVEDLIEFLVKRSFLLNRRNHTITPIGIKQITEDLVFACRKGLLSQEKLDEVLSKVIVDPPLREAIGQAVRIKTKQTKKRKSRPVTKNSPNEASQSPRLQQTSDRIVKKLQDGETERNSLREDLTKAQEIRSGLEQAIKEKDSTIFSLQEALEEQKGSSILEKTKKENELESQKRFNQGLLEEQRQMEIHHEEALVQIAENFETESLSTMAKLKKDYEKEALKTKNFFEKEFTNQEKKHEDQRKSFAEILKIKDAAIAEISQAFDEEETRSNELTEKLILSEKRETRLKEDAFLLTNENATLKSSVSGLESKTKEQEKKEIESQNTIRRLLTENEELEQLKTSSEAMVKNLQEKLNSTLQKAESLKAELTNSKTALETSKVVSEAEKVGFEEIIKNLKKELIKVELCRRSLEFKLSLFDETDEEEEYSLQTH